MRVRTIGLVVPVLVRADLGRVPRVVGFAAMDAQLYAISLDGTIYRAAL